MDYYFAILFFHIAGAIVLFMGMGIEWMGISRLNRASGVKQAGDWLKVLSSLKSMYISGGVILLVTGIYLASAKWGYTPWILVSFLLWLFITFQGSVLSGKKFRNLADKLSSESALSDSELSGFIGKLKLMNLLQSRLAIAFGAVFIMTYKPYLPGSIVVVIIAVILGIVPLMFKKKSLTAKAEEPESV